MYPVRPGCAKAFATLEPAIWRLVAQSSGTTGAFSMICLLSSAYSAFCWSRSVITEISSSRSLISGSLIWEMFWLPVAVICRPSKSGWSSGVPDSHGEHHPVIAISCCFAGVAVTSDDVEGQLDADPLQRLLHGLGLRLPDRNRPEVDGGLNAVGVSGFGEQLLGLGHVALIPRARVEVERHSPRHLRSEHVVRDGGHLLAAGGGLG